MHLNKAVRNFLATSVCAIFIAQAPPVFAGSDVYGQSDTQLLMIRSEQNSIVNLFVSVLPTIADINLRQIGVLNGIKIYQIDPKYTDNPNSALSLDQINVLQSDQQGNVNNLTLVQVGKTNVAVSTQQGRQQTFIPTSSIIYEFVALPEGSKFRFSTGAVDIQVLTPQAQTFGPSTFGNLH